MAWLLPGVKPAICSVAVTFLVWGSQLRLAVPVGSPARATLIGAAPTDVVDVDGGAEFELQAPTNAAIATAAVMNRTEPDTGVTVFTFCSQLWLGIWLTSMPTTR